MTHTRNSSSDSSTQAVTREFKAAEFKTVASRTGRKGHTRMLAAVSVFAVVAGMGAFALSSVPTQATPPMARADGAPVVVELFTSQGCYSCPPAEAKLADLALRDGIIALEHHVDYWDSLVYGSAGRWKDVFSSPQSTERQRAYNAVVPGRGHSYTPQMVIDGLYEAVGSRDSDVSSAISDARRSDDPRLAIAAVPAGDDGLTVRVMGAAAGDRPVGIWLVRFLREHKTQITSGENKGKTLIGRNIVREVTRIGEWRGENVEIELEGAKPDAAHGCAILVQPDRLGPIYGAAYCSLDKATNS